MAYHWLFTNLKNLLRPWLDLHLSLLHHETLMPHFTWQQDIYNSKCLFRACIQATKIQTVTVINIRCL